MMSPMPQLRVNVGDTLAVPPLVLVAVALTNLSCRTGMPFTTVTDPVPQMQVNGNTTVASPRLNSRRALTGVCSTSVRVSVPYVPLEKLGAEPICHCSSSARASAGTTSTISIAHITNDDVVFDMSGPL